MSRLGPAFDRARSEARLAIVAYAMAGDPDASASEALFLALAAAGADALEIGLPFSDPIADGPVIQAAGQRALRAGMTAARGVELVARLRASLEIPIVAMTYCNVILAFGVERFAAAAAKAGLDGLIVPDLPMEEAAPFRAPLERQGIDLVLLAAPTTPPARVAAIAQASRGFLYYVAVAGITGGLEASEAELRARLPAIRAASPLPVAVGFGIARPQQIEALRGLADGVVVGSEIIRRARSDGGGEAGRRRAAELVAELRAAAQPASAAR